MVYIYPSFLLAHTHTRFYPPFDQRPPELGTAQRENLKCNAFRTLRYDTFFSRRARGVHRKRGVTRQPEGNVA